MEKNQFRLADVILSVICVVFVAEAAAPVASIGNSQYFWWGVMILAFLLPYGLIAAELGTAYAGDGGLYDWIHAAYPQGKWAARASWYYWINFPLWMASLAVMCRELLRDITGLSYEEIAGVLQLSEGTVKSRLFRARDKLAAILRDGGNKSARKASKISNADIGRAGR